MNTYSRFDLNLVRGEGCFVYDQKGNKYLDFVTGIAVNCLGHCHPKLVQAIKEQSETLWHVSNLYHTEEANELSKKLVDLSGLESVFFCNSGTEAVEAAFKLTKKYAKNKKRTDEFEIIAMKNSFHGRTLGALSLTGQPKYQKSFEPLISGVKYAEFNNIEDVLSKVNENTAGIILELVQGEGGINPATIEFVKEIRKICDEHDILMIIDEVQTGIGRTGTMFAYEHYGILPDIVTLAKALGGGFPIGAMLAKEAVASAFAPGDHASTFGGNPLACKIANTILTTFVEDNILGNVTEIESYIRSQVEEMMKKHQSIVKIKGKGLLLGFEIKGDVLKIISSCIDKGLLVLRAGENVLRILPPLNVSKKEVDQCLSILQEVLEECE